MAEPNEPDPHPSLVRLVLYTLELAKRNDIDLEHVLNKSSNEVLVKLLDAVIEALPAGEAQFVRETLQRQMELKAMTPQKRRESFRLVRKTDEPS